MKRIKFLGAAGTVTGSSFVLSKYDEPGLMVDCGMFQGPSTISELNYKDLDWNPAELSDVVLTHAHLDHCGRLPLLTKGGFKNKIYMTRPSKDILEIALLDAARIAQQDEDKDPLYTEDDVFKLMRTIETVEYNQTFDAGGYSILMKDAGHILGSASLEVHDPGAKDGITKVIFSGDLGNSPQDVIRSTQQIESGEVVVMESTYGGRLHTNQVASEVIENEVKAIQESGGTLLIPCFSIQRTQEILHKLKHLKESGKIKKGIPVFLDSPMAIRVTNVYRDYKEYYNDEFANDASQGDPFEFQGLSLLEKPQDGRVIRKTNGPKIIIAGSGMMTGGRIVKHAFHNLPQGKTRLLIVGYQGEETLGRALLEGENPVEIFEQDIPVNAHITQVTSMSAHADEPKLLEWLKNIRDVKKVVLVHGEDESRAALSQSISTKLGINDILVPQLNEEHELTI